MTKIVIDQELEKVCLPLKEDEYSTLEKQLIRDGCLDTLKVWDRDGELVLLDGHNRFKICKEAGMPEPDTTTIDINNLDEAIIWIIDNQRGRRNATKEQLDYNSGRRYQSAKRLEAIRDDEGKFATGDPQGRNDLTGDNATAKKQAASEGLGEKTVRRNAKFAEGIDTIREHNPELATGILSSKTPLNKSDVEEVVNLAQELPPRKLVEVIQAGPAAIKEVVKWRKESRISGPGSASKPKQKEPSKAVLNAPMELWCNDCKWGFDVYLPLPEGITGTICPYCGGSNIDKREENWTPTEDKNGIQE